MTLHHPNGPNGYNTTFRDLGKMVAIYDEINDGGTGIENKLVEAVEQQDYDYDTVASLPTFINNMVTARNNLTTAKTNLNSAVSNYLLNVTADDINSTATTASGVLSDLVLLMRSATTGSPSGIYVATDEGFHTYFSTEFGVTLPNAAAGTYTTLSDTEAQQIYSGTLPSAARQIDPTFDD